MSQSEARFYASWWPVSSVADERIKQIQAALSRLGGFHAESDIRKNTRMG